MGCSTGGGCAVTAGRHNAGTGAPAPLRRPAAAGTQRRGRWRATAAAPRCRPQRCATRRGGTAHALTRRTAAPHFSLPRRGCRPHPRRLRNGAGGYAACCCWLRLEPGASRRGRGRCGAAAGAVRAACGGTCPLQRARAPPTRATAAAAPRLGGPAGASPLWAGDEARTAAQRGAPPVGDDARTAARAAAGDEVRSGRRAAPALRLRQYDRPADADGGVRLRTAPLPASEWSSAGAGRR